MHMDLKYDTLLSSMRSQGLKTQNKTIVLNANRCWTPVDVFNTLLVDVAQKLGVVCIKNYATACMHLRLFYPLI